MPSRASSGATPAATDPLIFPPSFPRDDVE
jgi:hypothetical protein